MCILFQASGSTKPKRKRGSKRKMIGCTTITEIDEATGEPLAPGKIKTTFVNQLGYLVRESVPIKYKLWKRNKVSDRPEDIVPDSEKDLLWKEVLLWQTLSTRASHQILIKFGRSNESGGMNS